MIISSKQSPLIIYVGLWCLYSLQGTLYTSGGMISRSILLILLLWSLYGCFKVNNQYKERPSLLKATNLFLIMATVYGGILILSGQQLIIMESFKQASNFDYLKNIYMSMLPLYVFYDFSRRGILTIEHLKVLGFILLGVSVVSFLRVQNDNIQMALDMRSTREEFTNNEGYEFVSLMPLLLFWHKKPIVQYLLLLVCIGFIIVSMKRGAILIGAVCFVYFLYAMFKGAKGKTRIVTVLLSVFAVILAIRIVSNMMETSDYFAYRVEQTAEGNSSHRDEIYSQFYNHFINETSLVKLLFGNGANATLKIGMNYAHNDWLELAINQGLIGIILYMFVFVALVKDYYSIRRKNRLYADVVAMSLLILFIKTLFSMSYSTISIAITLALGYCLAQQKNIKTTE